MISYAAVAATLSSTVIRVLAYIFFRWIPGHQLPPIIYTATLIYISSFIAGPILDGGARKGTLKDGKRDLQAVHLNGAGNGSKPETTIEVKINGRVYNSKDPHVKWVENVPHILQTLLLGLPSSKGVLWSLVTMSINVLLVLGVVDVVYRGPMLYQSHELAFTRVGFVSDVSAKILVREPDTAQVPIYFSYRGAPGSGVDDAWKSAGQVYWLSKETDFTTSFTLTNLRPSAAYQYAVSNNHTGIFTTAPPAGQTSLGLGKFTFLTSSCIKPRFPYNPFAHPLTIPGLKHLAKWVPKLQASFMLFLGDFIYIDVPRRFGTDAETYRREYRQVYSSPDWPAASKSLPWLHVIDDHEIANDWDKQDADPYPAATDPWDIYHSSLNPPPALPNASYFQFTQGPASFFLMDTRRHRSPEYPALARSPNKTMLGTTQLSSLLAFLKRDEPEGVKWKFVISSIPFTRNWRLNSADTWANYLHERRIILEAMWDVGLRGDGIGVVLLSGDRHEFAATAFPPPKDSKWPLSATVHEFSTSPLSMFYLPVRSYWEVPGEDDVEEVCIKYAPDGNSKFGAVELEEVTGGEQGLLRFRLFVDGVESWDYVLMTPPAVGGGGRGKDAIWG
ncbi:PhoD-like phosphatase-domain-containing protein [Usnea florida]